MKKIALLTLPLVGLIANPTMIRIGTGSTTGVYYGIGTNICRLLKETDIKCRAESSGGSVINVRKLKKEQIDLGIAQSDVVYNALHGLDKFKGKPIKNLKIVMALHPELLTFVVRKDSGIKSLLDIKGKVINIGNPGSGNEATVKLLFQNCSKISLKDIKVEQLKAGECPNALKDKKIAGYFFVVGHPTANIKDASNSTQIDLISLADLPVVRKLVKEKPYYAFGTIPAGIYKGIKHPTKTYGVRAILVTTSNSSEKLIYTITKTILTNFDKFRKFHPAYKNLTKRDLLKGFELDKLHPGAKKAFQEEGLI